jgi:hypothetical protein
MPHWYEKYEHILTMFRKYLAAMLNIENVKALKTLFRHCIS